MLGHERKTLGPNQQASYVLEKIETRNTIIERKVGLIVWLIWHSRLTKTARSGTKSMLRARRIGERCQI